MDYISDHREPEIWFRYADGCLDNTHSLCEFMHPLDYEDANIKD